MASLNESNVLLHEQRDSLRDEIIENIQKTMNSDFLHSFIASVCIIVVSELCDKTFFIAAVMAMRHSLLPIYTGAISALCTMTIISAILGKLVTKLIPQVYTYYASNVLFLYFGIKMLKEAYYLSSSEQIEDFKAVQSQMEITQISHAVKSDESHYETNNDVIQTPRQNNVVIMIHRYISGIFVETFVLIFLAVSIVRKNVHASTFSLR